MYIRNKASHADFNKATVTSNLAHLPNAQVYLLAISDTAIQSFSASIPKSNALVAHTSGSIAITDIDSQHRRAVFYPVQTFSKGQIQDFNGVPFAIEAENKTDSNLLSSLAKNLGGTPFLLYSDQRKYLHMAAVIVNNFVNQLYCTASEILEEQDISFDLLKPLIQKTAAVVQEKMPKEVQTGPAKRKDLAVINKHLDLLGKDNKALYQLLTNAIQKTQQQS